jgi:hypothetical protein
VPFAELARSVYPDGGVQPVADTDLLAVTAITKSLAVLVVTVGATAFAVDVKTPVLEVTYAPPPEYASITPAMLEVTLALNVYDAGSLDAIR